MSNFKEKDTVAKALKLAKREWLVGGVIQKEMTSFEISRHFVAHHAERNDSDQAYFAGFV